MSVLANVIAVEGDLLLLNTERQQYSLEPHALLHVQAQSTGDAGGGNMSANISGPGGFAYKLLDLRMQALATVAQVGGTSFATRYTWADEFAAGVTGEREIAIRQLAIIDEGDSVGCAGLGGDVSGAVDLMTKTPQYHLTGSQSVFLVAVRWENNINGAVFTATGTWAVWRREALTRSGFMRTFQEVGPSHLLPTPA